MYKIFMLIALPALAIGWVAYAMWMHKIREEEKKQPKKESQRLTQTKSEISDWAQKMAAYQPPKRKTSGDEQPENQ
jgi:flagellar basal body-associated protein FliL